MGSDVLAQYRADMERYRPPLTLKEELELGRTMAERSLSYYFSLENGISFLCERNALKISDYSDTYKKDIENILSALKEKGFPVSSERDGSRITITLPYKHVITAHRKFEGGTNLLFRSPEAEESRQKLINYNLGIAVLYAYNYAGRGIDLEDLVQEGNIGLSIASNRYDYRRGCRFSTIAGYWVENRIFKKIKCGAGVVRIPGNAVQSLKKFEIEAGRKEMELDEYLESINISKSLKDVLIKARSSGRVYTIYSNDDEHESEKVLDFDYISSEDCEREKSENSEYAINLISELKKNKPRQWQIFYMRYVLGWSLDRIGASLNISKERVRQIELGGKKRLREKLEVA